jgi:hypothetical protein
MKKVLAALLVVLLIFIALTYISVSSTDQKFDTGTVLSSENGKEIDYTNLDSIEIIPSNLYKGNLIKDLMQGDNYRREWATPVKVPVVDLEVLFGGVHIIDEGGGKQTHSLDAMAADGTLYTLRSVNKDPQPLIPPVARTLRLENIIVDGISAQHPYGAILAASLAELAELEHTHPKMVFLPKQPRLKKYNKKYGDRLYLLEYESEGKKNWTRYNNITSIVDTDDLQELKMDLKDQLKVDERLLVRNRLFDLLIGDWDRHAEQWGWALQLNNSTYKAIPVAADRDNAFFHLDGFLPAILTNKHVNPLVRPFEKDIDHMEGLVYPVDAYFLLNTPEEVFVEEAKYLQKVMTNDAIKEAFNVLPKEIYALRGEALKEKIIKRREHLVEHAKEFHKILRKKGALKKPLKGSEDIEISKELQRCFECG